MKKTDFNLNWNYSVYGINEWKEISLPHDAMIVEPRIAESAGGTNTGWFTCNDYIYEKTFELNEIAKTQILEFEGVYRNAEVYLNGEKLAIHHYGYTGFYVDVSGKMNAGKNVIRVIARNADQPNSRWYSGAGIYRPVWLWTAEDTYIVPDGVRIHTVSLDPTTVHIDVQTVGEGEMQIDVLEGGMSLTSVKTSERSLDIEIPNGKLWSVDTPHLYQAKVNFNGDEYVQTFGIRTVKVSPEKGFELNGERVLLLGACMHHDNGFLGAACHPFAEERKIRLLKEAGYNAIRSSHNPCSKALLDACDKLGMLVLDEMYDGWYIHKTKYDYADYMENNWRSDLADLIAKDYSHPSVVMYSIGNEVGETAKKKGYELAEEMQAYIKGIDVTRPVTCGINIFFNFLSYMGFGVYSDKKAEKPVKPGKKKQAVGSEFFNNLVGILGADFMKFGATLHGSTVRSRDVFARLDVAGYNYGIFRYKKDVKKFPSRIILGSETFCGDAYKFYEFAKTHPAIIGDFVWTGMDYLGECGIGAKEYKDYAPDYGHGVGWLTASAGVLDLTGRGEGALGYTRVAFEKDVIRMAVVPVNHTNDRHSPSSWRSSNAVESWTWEGCEGNPAKVEVYARAAKVVLYLNDKVVGEKKMGKDCLFRFKTTYQLGELKAVAVDANERILGECVLRTAGKETKVTLTPELSTVKKDELCYIRIALTDENGERKPLARDMIQLKVKGGKLLAAGSACPYYEGSYFDGTADTYFGEALAIVQPEGEEIELTATSKYGNATCKVTVK